MSESIGEAIKRIRKGKMTQKELAEKTGLAEITIRQYEHGDYEPKHENIKKIAAALGVHLADLAPDRYPVAFESPESYEAAWLAGGGHHGREGDLKVIRYNVTRLNDDGVREVAEKTDAMVKSGKYKILDKNRADHLD